MIKRLENETTYGFCYDTEKKPTLQDVIKKVNEIVDYINEKEKESNIVKGKE